MMDTMDGDTSTSVRRMSTRTRRVAPKMVAALASNDNRTQAVLARLEALENDNPGLETVEVNDDSDASLDDDDEQVFQKKQSKSTKRKTRQAKALENAKKAPRTFHELLHEGGGWQFVSWTLRPPAIREIVLLYFFQERNSTFFRDSGLRSAMFSTD
ncbi:hypothetical protein AgCh_021820 [Apium graveolens]